MEAVKTLLRLFSYLFHGLLALFLIAVSGLTLASGVPSLRLGMLPWTGATLVWVVLGGSVFGLLTVLLAIAARWRILFLLWSLAVTVLLIRGYIFTGYRFHSVGLPVCLVVGSLVAIVGAWLRLVQTQKRSLRY